MDWIMLVIAFILGAISMFMLVCIGYTAKHGEPANRVHFYMARDKNGELWLYMGKPIRTNTAFRGDLDKGVTGLINLNFRCFGLNKADYDNLKWEDEPVEVFINMEEKL